MNKSALAPALAAALLTAFAIAGWSFWPSSAPEPAPAHAIPAEVDQFPGIVPYGCIPSSITPARREMSE